MEEINNLGARLFLHVERAHEPGKNCSVPVVFNGFIVTCINGKVFWFQLKTVAHVLTKLQR